MKTAGKRESIPGYIVNRQLDTGANSRVSLTERIHFESWSCDLRSWFKSTIVCFCSFFLLPVRHFLGHYGCAECENEKKQKTKKQKTKNNIVMSWFVLFLGCQCWICWFTWRRPTKFRRQLTCYKSRTRRAVCCLISPAHPLVWLHPRRSWAYPLYQLFSRINISSLCSVSSGVYWQGRNCYVNERKGGSLGLLPSSPSFLFYYFALPSH